MTRLLKISLAFTLLLFTVIAANHSARADSVTTQGGDNPWSLADTPWPTAGGNNQRTGQSQYRGVQQYPSVVWRWAQPPVASGFTIGISNTLIIKASPTTILDFDGKEVLSFESASVCFSVPTTTQNGNYFFHTFYDFTAFKPDGTIDWVAPFVFGCNHSTPAIDDDGILYVGFTDGRYVAIDLENRALVWSYSAVLGGSGGTPAIGYDGTIYVTISSSGEGGRIVAINPDGSERWRNASYGFGTNPVVGPEGNIYSARFQVLTAFAPSGDILWHFEIPEKPCTRTTPAVGTDGTVYFTARGDFGRTPSKLYAVNPDGSQKWVYVMTESDFPWVCSTPIVDVDNNVYFCSDNGYCYGVDSEGDLMWDIFASESAWLRAAPLIFQDEIMLIPGDGEILAITTSDAPPPVIEYKQFVPLVVAD